MSYKNPIYGEVLANSTSENQYLRMQFRKSLLNIATRDFVRKNGRRPTIEDSQEIYNLFEAQWKDVLTPEREEDHRKNVLSFFKKIGWI